MVRFSAGVACLAAILAISTISTYAGDASKSEIDALKKDIEDLRRKLNASSSSVGKSSVDKALESKYGPNATVSTKNGKLTIGGLLQVWYYSIENDNKGIFDDPAVNGVADTNEHADNDSFRIRRSELKFTIDIHENVTAVILIDPAREATSYPALDGGFVRSTNNVAAEFINANGVNGRAGNVTSVQNGGGAVPRLLRDAYINYHGVVPHHDFQIGQFKPPFGEEGIRSSSHLDFVERAMITQPADNRDLGVQVHGTWWDDRFQYWFGAFNGAGNFYGSAGIPENRADDNDEKDFYVRWLLRPLWKNETWGSIEIGWSSAWGKHGEASSADPVNAPINGLNRNEGAAMKHAAWASYMPGGPVKGWWLRSEWLYVKDRHAPNTVVDLAGADNEGDGYQDNGRPFRSLGWFFSTGYKISDSIFCDSAPGWLKPWEFTFRYQAWENTHAADLVANNHTDNFTTQVWTGGINYYIKGHNAKIQLNYNVVDDPEGNDNAGNRQFHDVNNDNFVVNFQVAF